MILALSAPTQQIDLPHASPLYALRVRLEAKDLTADPLTGAATVTLTSRKTGRLLQTLRLPNLVLFKGQMAGSFGSAVTQPFHYDDDYTFVFEDMNFDGKPDLAICTGLNSGYGLPSYDVYLFQPKRGRFVKHQTLTRLASEHLGLFEIDAKLKAIQVFDKDGAAWHQSSWYGWRNGDLTLLKTEVDDATGTEEVITTRTRDETGWKTRIEKAPLPVH